MALPLSTNVVERLSENSEQASFCGPTKLHNGMKRYSHRRLALPKTRDPTRPAIFQTVSRRIILRSSPRIHREFIAARYGLGGVGPTSEQLLLLSRLLVGFPWTHPSFLPLFTQVRGRGILRSSHARIRETLTRRRHMPLLRVEQTDSGGFTVL